ncbi:hypothetical protein [Frankia sp. CiP3]|uniref:hypothetical protein n=1 Tax=Frankia sp. CiP3 TaxID=2880971 RepID=UPI001EF4BB35|nr:hypothetical protein [Frankia sp. CiP3]
MRGYRTNDWEEAVGPVAATSANADDGDDGDDGTGDGGAERGQLPVLYGVIRFESGETRQIRDATVTFGSAESAELFAVENGWHDYQVTPLFFFVDIAATAGIRMSPDAALVWAGGRSAIR